MVLKPILISISRALFETRMQGQQLHHWPDLQKRARQEGRRGDYLGKTVRVIPHVCEIRSSSNAARVLASQMLWTWPSLVAERLATSNPALLEAVRQMSLKLGPNNGICPPELRAMDCAAGELKTKPTQLWPSSCVKSAFRPMPCCVVQIVRFHRKSAQDFRVFNAGVGVISM